MPNFGNKQTASKLGKAIVTAVTTGLSASATNFTTYFGTQTRHVRLIHTLTGGIWFTLDSTGVITAGSSANLLPINLPEYFECSPGQVLNWLTTSTSTGFVVVTEMS